MPKTNNEPIFLKKVFLGMDEKCFFLTVFLKNCVLLKTTFIVFSAKHAVAVKISMLKKTKISPKIVVGF